MSRRARRTDPETSQEAAERIEEALARNQSAVLVAMRHMGPCTDEELVDQYGGLASSPYYKLPQQSPSGLRSRRNELAERALVVNTGLKRPTKSGSKAIVWRALEGSEIATITNTLGGIIGELQEEERRKRVEGTLFDPGPSRQEDQS